MTEPEPTAEPQGDGLSYSYRESWWARTRAALVRRPPRDPQGPGAG